MQYLQLCAYHTCYAFMTLVGRHTTEPQLARDAAAATIAVTLRESLSGTFLQTLLFSDKSEVSLCSKAENNATYKSSQHQQHVIESRFGLAVRR